MTYAEQLTVGGVKYSTLDAAEQARRVQEASAQAAQERTAKLAQTFEAELKGWCLATGATEDDWKRQRESIIAKAREAATLEKADVTRMVNRARYG